jgi:hypothetical protein
MQRPLRTGPWHSPEEQVASRLQKNEFDALTSAFPEKNFGKPLKTAV